MRYTFTFRHIHAAHNSGRLAVCCIALPSIATTVSSRLCSHSLGSCIPIRTLTSAFLQTRFNNGRCRKQVMVTNNVRSGQVKSGPGPSMRLARLLFVCLYSWQLDLGLQLLQVFQSASPRLACLNICLHRYSSSLTGICADIIGLACYVVVLFASCRPHP